jgi:hypothetical protein
LNRIESKSSEEEIQYKTKYCNIMREVLLTTLVMPIMLLIFSQIIIATLGFSFMMKQQQTQTQNRRLLQMMTTTTLFLSSDEEKKDDDNNSLYQENREDSSGQIIANNMTLLPFQTVPLKMIVFDKDGTLRIRSRIEKEKYVDSGHCFKN